MAVEKECMEKKCSKTSITVIGILSVFIMFFLVWLFKEIGWLSKSGYITGLED